MGGGGGGGISPIDSSPSHDSPGDRPNLGHIEDLINDSDEDAADAGDKKK